MVQTRYLLIFATPLMFACGGDSTERIDDVTDGAQDAPADAPVPDACQPTECRVLPDYGNVGEGVGTAFLDYGELPLNWMTRINDECGSDSVVVGIVLNERGAFRNGVKAGTYPLQARDLNPETCATCVRLVADPDSPDPRCYFAIGGELVLTADVSSTVDRFVGSLTDFSFGPVSCDAFEPIQTDCSSEIGIMTFDSVVSSTTN